MLLAVLLLHLALWTRFTVAFYPYTPKWLKEKEELTISGEVKADSVATVETRDGLTLEVERRRTQFAESPVLLAHRQASRLKAKLNDVYSASSLDFVERRANSYHVMEAAEPTQTHAAGINQDGTDYTYFVKAGLGSKNKQVYLLLDTGAGSTWVMGSDCTNAPCSLHTTFGQGDSSTHVDAGKPFAVSYGSGSVNGSLITDTVSLGGLSLKYTFGQASKVSDDFSHFAFDGILGMSMSQGATDNFMKALAESKLLDKNVIGVYLNRASDGSNHGEIKFGSPNPDLYTGDISYTAVGSDNGNWAIRIDEMTYDGKKSGAGGVLSYIDTGTSFILGPPELTKKIHDVIPGSASSDGKTYSVPCDSNKVLTFTFSGVNYEVSPKDWISPKDSSGNCTSNIYGQEVVKGSWLLGDAFLKNVYTVFDRDEKRIGLAVAAGSKGQSSSSSSSGNGSPTQTTVGPTTGTGTILTPDVTTGSDASTQSMGRPLSVGHETSSGSDTTNAKPTESSKSEAAELSIKQNAVVASMAFLVFLIGMVG